MLKKSKIICMSFIFLCSIFSLIFLNCAGKQPQPQDETAIETKGGDLEEAKQSAESAEWEAHRLREELNRKKQKTE